jgi:anti-sigma-K factor RskA
MNDHELIEELTSARALRELEPEDAAALEAEMASHGPDCAECRRLTAEAEEVAGRLAFAVDPVPLPEGFEDRVVAAATAERTALRPPSDLARRPRPRQGGMRLRPLVAIAASVVLFAAGWLASSLLGNDAGEIPPGARVVALQGEDVGTMAVAYTPGEPGVYVVGSDLQTPPEDSVYELWLIRDGSPVPGACFRPAKDGSLFEFVDAEVGNTDTMAVTVEPSECSTQPTSDPILIAEIPRA